MGINEKMTSIADGLRILSETSDPMGLDAMSGHISQANETVDEQSALITQIKRALRGKGTATEGGAGDPAKEEQEVVFPTITENGNYEILPDDGKVMSKATVNIEVPERYEEGYNEGYSKGFADNEPVLESLNVTVNGEYIPPQNVDGFNSVIVNVPPEVADSVLIENGTCGDNVSWELYNNGLLYIFGEGVMHTYNFNNAPFKFKSIKNVIIENGITTISDYLLTYVTSLKSVCIPDSVISIGKQVFYRCFDLESITFGSGLTKIDYAAFADCETLTNIFYKGTKSEWDLINIDEGYNEYLLAATLHCEYEDVTVLEAQEKNIDITTNGTTEVEPDENKTLSKVIINVNVPTEGGSGDSGSNEQLKAAINGTLTELTAEDFEGVTTIKPYAFYQQTLLESVNIPDSVTSIKNYAFSGCSSIQLLKMPIDITIDVSDSSVFSGCNAITDIVLTYGGGTTIDYNYSNVRRTPWANSARASLQHITFPDGITKIGNHILRECTALTGVVIPKSVTDIGTYAFYNCTGFQNGTGVYIPRSVTSIGENAFYGLYSSSTPIYYEGSQEEWAAINIAATGNLGLNDDYIHYNTPM